MSNVKKYGRKHIGKKFKTDRGIDIEVIDGGELPHSCTIKMSIPGSPTVIKENARVTNVLKGAVKYPYSRSVCDIGYVGVGRHKISVDGELTKVYTVWVSMIHRCYNETQIRTQDKYKDLLVCPEWNNFQTFGDWFEEHYIKGYELHVGIMVRDDVKMFCSNTCVFIPRLLNGLLVKTPEESPITHIMGKFYTSVRVNGKVKPLGPYKTKEDAISAYNKARGEEILKWKERMYNEWKHYLESGDEKIRSKYEELLDNIK